MSKGREPGVQGEGQNPSGVAELQATTMPSVMSILEPRWLPSSLCRPSESAGLPKKTRIILRDSQ
jgi:hypothetical protein